MGAGGVGAELAGSSGVLLVENADMKDEDVVMKDKALNPIDSALDDDTTSNQEVSNSANESALQVLHQGSEI